MYACLLIYACMYACMNECMHVRLYICIHVCVRSRVRMHTCAVADYIFLSFDAKNKHTVTVTGPCLILRHACGTAHVNMCTYAVAIEAL